MSDRRKRAAPAPAAAAEHTPVPRRTTRALGPAEIEIPEFSNAATPQSTAAAAASTAETATPASKRARTGEHKAEQRANSRSRRGKDDGDYDEEDAAINEESKEEASADTGAAAAAASTRPPRLASVSNPRGSVVDLTEPGVGGSSGRSRSKRLISMPATTASPSKRRTRAGMDERAQHAQQQESPNKQRRGAKRGSYVDHGSESDLSETHASAAAATAHSFRDRSASASAAAAPKLTRGRQSEIEENLEAQAESMGITVQELRNIQGLTEENAEAKGRTSSRRSGAAAAPAAAAASAAAAEDDDESVGHNKRRSTRGRRNIRDEEDEEAFSPESGGEQDEDEEASEEEEEELYNNNGRPRRHVTKPLTFAEEQGREEVERRRSGRNHRHESDEEKQEEEGVQRGYLRTIVTKTHQLSDGRVVSDREYRSMLRSGEPFRLLEPGETPHPPGEDPKLQAAAASSSSLRRSASDRGSSAHQADVRRSSRPRQQVQHYTAGKATESGDESPTERYVRPQAGRARAGGKSRRAGRSNRHRRPVSYGDSSSPSSSSSSSSDSDSSGSRRHGRRHRGGHKHESNGIQPLHLQIQHQMRRMEAEASKIGGSASAASSSLPPKTKDGRLADIDPISIDSTTDWSSIGGLDAHVASLKEMVVLPLLYPELFESFHLQPPKGVLFYGQPVRSRTQRSTALALVSLLFLGSRASFSCLLCCFVSDRVRARRSSPALLQTRAARPVSAYHSSCAKVLTV